MVKPGTKSILVSGGAGYVGAHTCKALWKANYLPVTFDSLVHGHRDAVKWGPFVCGDILDRDSLDRAISEHRPEAIIHFAAFAYVGESTQDPGKYYRNNVAGSLTLLEAARDAGIKVIVFSSTCATYGSPQRLPILETTPQHPINPYGTSKMMVEHILRDFDIAHGVRSIALRYFNAAGADEDGELGENHDPETHLIPLILDAASGRRENVTVFGTDYPTPDGTCLRDYIHVSDLADAHVLALSRLMSGAPSDVFNLGNGRGFSVREVINSVERITGMKVPVQLGPRRSGDPAALVSDSTKARDVLGWQPRLTHLDDIVRTAWAGRRNVSAGRMRAPEGNGIERMVQDPGRPGS